MVQIQWNHEISNLQGKQKLVWKIREFDCVERMTFASSFGEVGKTEGSRNRDSTVVQLLLVIRDIFKQFQRNGSTNVMFRLYLCFNRQWIFLTVWIGTQKGMRVLHVCPLSWTIFWNYHWTLKEKVRKFQLLNYVITVRLISNDCVNILPKKRYCFTLLFTTLLLSGGRGRPKKEQGCLS